MKRLSHAARAERRKAIVLRLREGASVTDTAKAFGITENYVRMIASVGQVKVRRRFEKTEKRKAQLREFWNLGRTQADFARLTGMPGSQVSLYAKQLGLKFRKDTKCREPVVAASRKRAATMLALYKAGYTLEQIGHQYGITRERVRQLMTKHFGVSRKDGGQASLAERRRVELRSERDGLCLAKLGCTRDQYREVLRIGREAIAAGSTRERTPMGAYITQRRNARKRGIGWELNFWQWWTIWQESGHWERRGRGQGYVMCRKGDEGPYAAGNVFIATAIENVSTAKHKKSGLPTGVHRNPSGTFSAYRTVANEQAYLGTFPTPELAHAAYLMAAPQSQVAA